MDFLEHYLKAGRIAFQVRENARKKNHEGSTLLKICESIEKEIIEKGAHPAFPVNVSLNEIAAHYTAEPNDDIIVKQGDILKIDIGVHVNGYIADTAVTVSYNPNYDHLISTAENALYEAIKIAKVDTKSNDIGKIIEITIKNHGLTPIQNLSGHSIEKYTIHAGKSIPNIWTLGSSFKLVENQAYAIEPFVTTKDGMGIVHEGRIANIFALVSRKPSRDKLADELLDIIWERYKSLPFALRWLMDCYEEKQTRNLLEILRKRRNIHAYPILIEGREKIVAQAEHTIIPQVGNTTIITS